MKKIVKVSIRIKVLVLCILLVLLTTAGLSIAYYLVTRQDKHRESRQRIRIAFTIILDDMTDQMQTYRKRFDDFLKQDIKLSWISHFYNQEKHQLESSQFMISSLSKVAEELKHFGSIISADRLMLYAVDKRLLAVYRHLDGRDRVGGYVISASGKDTYLPMDDFSKLSEMHYKDLPVPDTPLPPNIQASYPDDIPDAISVRIFHEHSQLGIRIAAPLLQGDEKVGLLVGDVFFTQPTVQRYATITETAVNLFAGNQLSIGTLPAQTQLAPEILARSVTCETLLDKKQALDAAAVTFDEHDYYQGRCVFKHEQETIGAITVSLSQAIEKQEIRKVLTAVLLIAGIAIGIAIGLSVLFSRKTIGAIHSIVRVIGAVAEGDLRPTAISVTHDEIGMLALKLNQMTGQLRHISEQVQGASSSVNATADTILREMESLIHYMQQQSTSVDNTTESIEKIKQFIDTVAQSTNDLLTTAAQILSSIQQTRASIEEVTTSTGSLTTNLHLISSSVDQVNQTMKQISGNTTQLEDASQQTEAEMQHIDQLLQDVAHNAERTRKLADETMDAATSGQVSVEISIQGMAELKDVVAQTAQIIQEVNSWGEEVSSILGIVDDITEQTSLLALNASIISAQAGTHGRGFAVVADEIKELATRTKNSTKEINTLVRALQKKTEEGVTHTTEGLEKADQSMQLAQGVQEAFDAILERATRSSNRAADTTHAVQQTTDSSQTIRTSMTRVTEMVSHIKTGLQEQAQDIEQVVEAVENISGMSEQVNRANQEQKRAAGEIESSMEEMTERFSHISDRTETLQQHSDQLVAAMHAIESTTEHILENTRTISEDTVKNLVHQSEVLREIVNIFKVS
jgi:methyl-accepting chemotaxis protein